MKPSESTVTTHQAKKIIKQYLDAHNLPYTKLTARTIGFQDLLRCDCIFVQVHGWTPSTAWDGVKAAASEYGFCVEAPGCLS